MEHLPLDLKIALMLSIDEFSSLRSLILTSHSMHDAFAASRTSILSSVLRKALGPSLLCSALALHHSTTLRSRDFFTIESFLSTWAPPHPYPSPDTAVFNSLARRHALVEWFLYDMCFAMVKRFPYHRPPEATHHNLAPEEIARVHRAFYHFDLYAVLFADRVHPGVDYEDCLDMDETREVFLDRLPPWEIEELMCVHAHMHRRLGELAECVVPEVHAAELAEAGPSHSSLPRQKQLQSRSTPSTLSRPQSPSPGTSTSRAPSQSHHNHNTMHSPSPLTHYSHREVLLSYGLSFLRSLLTSSASPPSSSQTRSQPHSVSANHPLLQATARGKMKIDQRFLGN
ncbi:MAG: hypothetical protein LQ340_005706, partial [Diploschistes diacapsis]